MLAVRPGSLPIAPPLRELGERRKQGRKKPSQPHAFALTMRADFIHSIIPVAGAHQWQPVRAGLQRSLDRTDAVVIERRHERRARWPLVHAVLIRTGGALMQERSVSIENRPVAGRTGVLERVVHEPQTVVLNARTHAFAAGLVPPMLHVAFRELPRSR